MLNNQPSQITTAVPFDGQKIIAINKDDKVYIIPKVICKNKLLESKSQTINSLYSN